MKKLVIFALMAFAFLATAKTTVHRRAAADLQSLPYDSLGVPVFVFQARRLGVRIEL